MRFRFLLVLFAVTILIASVSAATMTPLFGDTDKIIVNSTSVLSEAPGMPYDIWVYSILAAIALILISYVKFPHGEEGIIGVMAIFPAAFALFSSFNIDRITGAGFLQASDLSYVFMEKHTLYHFDLMAYTCLLPLLVLTLINVARIWINMRAMNQIAQVDNDNEQ